jgi:DNA processing protein
MSRACLGCLARARLLELLAPRIEVIAKAGSSRSVRELLARTNDELLAVTRVREAEREGLLAAAAAAAREDDQTVRDGGALCIHGDAYPERLRDLTDPPHALFHTGPVDRLLRLIGDKPVAIVGSRRASESGKNAAWELGRGLSAAHVTVISGMAFGIDAACHRGALDGGAAAVAVLASGADRASPVSHRALYRELRSVGTVISEMPWGASPWPWLFPARNRIMAALSHLTVVVEAAPRSGSLITATFATELGRTVGAMPGAPAARVTAGNNQLLRDGCAVIRGPRDALEEIYGVSGAAELQAQVAHDGVADEPGLLALLDAVEVGGSLDEMAERTGMGAREVRAGLARLERSGLIRRAGLGGYVAVPVG